MKRKTRPESIVLRVSCAYCGHSATETLPFAEVVAILRDGRPFRCVVCGASDPILSAPGVRVTVEPRQKTFGFAP